MLVQHFRPFKVNRLVPVRGEDWIKHPIRTASQSPSSIPAGWLEMLVVFLMWRNTAGRFRRARCAQLLFFHSRASRTFVPTEAPHVSLWTAKPPQQMRRGHRLHLSKPQFRLFFHPWILVAPGNSKKQTFKTAEMFCAEQEMDAEAPKLQGSCLLQRTR